jgi:hypothetical protein
MALMAVYVLQPVKAAAPIQAPAALTGVQAVSLDVWPPGGVWPPPQEPVDITPITPFETVGGLPYEP